MTKTHFRFVAAVLLAFALTGTAFAQNGNDEAAPDAGNGEPTEMTEEQGTDEPMDPASPEADGMDGDETDEPQTDMAEPGDEAAEEETGPADVISDSSERALAEGDLSDLDCAELWIARNEIFDRNGYCFRSERGQEYFDNSDCTSDSQDILSDLEWQNVDLIKDVEANNQCN